MNGPERNGQAEIAQLAERVRKLEERQIEMAVSQLGLAVLLFKASTLLRKVKYGRLDDAELDETDSRVNTLFEEMLAFARGLAGE